MKNQQDRYPSINIRSKNELVKCISINNEITYRKNLHLVNNVIKNYDKYWRDNPKFSEPEKNKYVRNTKDTPLGKLLEHINISILKPYDAMLPEYIFGGVQNKSHILAAQHLLGAKRQRTLLQLDISRFFEQITEKRVFHFFYSKVGCSKAGAKLLSQLCCVSQGPKNNPGERQLLARGFPTSSRIAIWCTLDLIIKINNLTYKELKGHNPRFAIYVDDIGITASRISKQQMKKLAETIEETLLKYDKNQKLPINQEKTKIISYDDKKGIEYLGLKLRRNKIDISSTTQSKVSTTKNKKSLKGLKQYKQQVRKSNHKMSKKCNANPQF